MKTILAFTIFSLCFYNFSFSQEQQKSTKKFSIGISQSIVYLGNMEFTKKDQWLGYDLENFTFSPGLKLEYKFAKYRVSFFTGLEYYEIQGTTNYYFFIHFIRPDTSYHDGFVSEKKILKNIEIPIGFQFYFLNKKYRYQPYLYSGTSIKLISEKTESAYFDISTKSISESQNENKFSRNRINSNDKGFVYFHVSVGCDFQLYTNLFANVEIKTKYNIVARNTYMLIGSAGLKYQF